MDRVTRAIAQAPALPDDIDTAAVEVLGGFRWSGASHARRHVRRFFARIRSHLGECLSTRELRAGTIP